MTHPQFDEIVAAVARFLATPVGKEPKLEIWIDRLMFSVRFVIDHDVVGSGREQRLVEEHVMHLHGTREVPDARCREWLTAKGVAFRKFNPVETMGYIVPVQEAAPAALLALEALAELYEVPADEWLFVTDIREFDNWPSPLPKPKEKDSATSDRH